MLTSSEFKDYLKTLFPDINIYNGVINQKDYQCIGVFVSGSSNGNNIAIGGLENTSYSSLPITLLIHWTEETNLCQEMANQVYEALVIMKDTIMSTTRVLYLNMLDPCPISINRDSNNICEMIIRLNIIYER